MNEADRRCVRFEVSSWGATITEAEAGLMSAARTLAGDGADVIELSNMHVSRDVRSATTVINLEVTADGVAYFGEHDG